MENGITPVEASSMGPVMASLLRDVRQEGKEFAIMDNGVPIARLLPASEADRKKLDALMAESRAIAERCTLNGLSWKELRDEGRR